MLVAPHLLDCTTTMAGTRIFTRGVAAAHPPPIPPYALESILIARIRISTGEKSIHNTATLPPKNQHTVYSLLPSPHVCARCARLQNSKRDSFSRSRLLCFGRWQHWSIPALSRVLRSTRSTCRQKICHVELLQLRT